MTTSAQPLNFLFFSPRVGNLLYDHAYSLYLWRKNEEGFKHFFPSSRDGHRRLRREFLRAGVSLAMFFSILQRTNGKGNITFGGREENWIASDEWWGLYVMEGAEALLSLSKRWRKFGTTFPVLISKVVGNMPSLHLHHTVPSASPLKCTSRVFLNPCIFATFASYFPCSPWICLILTLLLPFLFFLRHRQENISYFLIWRTKWRVRFLCHFFPLPGHPLRWPWDTILF